ncbi:MAG: T9SS type A sorting domain-containing protein [Candidatus Korarchaeota archaeon]|nr:T9SS type A sorting domain-containing protein [Candidatus Korarchaeota archaeon]
MNKFLTIQIGSIFSVLLLLLCLPTLSFGQLPNAYDYFPLATGNEWIYWVLQFDPYRNVFVASDTLLGDSLRVYKVYDEGAVYYYYYNEDSTVVYDTREFPENMDSGFAFLDTRHGLGAKWVVTYDGITRAFAIKDTGGANMFGRVWNTAQVYEVVPDADSLIYLEAMGRYAVGLGLIQFWESGLVYAKINGVEYGERPTSVERTQRRGIPEKFQLHLYPNPVNKSATLLFDSPSLKQVEVKIIDILGRTVQKFTLKPTTASFQLVWDGRDINGKLLANGTYFVVARAGNFSKAIKFIYLR